MTCLTKLPCDIFTTHIIPHILNKNIITFRLQQEDILLCKMFHIFDILCSCKYYSKFDNNDLWITIMLLIFPKNYTITDKSVHIDKKYFNWCSKQWIHEKTQQNNILWQLSYSERHNLWVDEGSPCSCINHYDINTLEIKEKYDINEKRNFKKIMLVKLRSYIEKKYISKSEINKLKKINKQLELSGPSNHTLIRHKNTLQTKYNQQQNILVRLNYSIDGNKDKKMNSYINYLNISKKQPDYTFEKYKNIWNNMSTTEKNKYKM